MPLSITDGALPWQRLAVTNKHSRDDRISFEEETHTYTIDGEHAGWVSCTGFIHNFFPPFNADEVITKMMKSAKWKPGGESYEKYKGMTPDAIKKMWTDNGGESSALGTRMHLDIEHYYNASPIGNLAADDWEANASTEWNYFMEFERRWRIPRGLYPFRTEWLVFHEAIKLAGSIDMVFTKEDGTLAIYDWKRAKEIRFENPYQSGLDPLTHLPNSNYWIYSLQLNIYRRVLELLYNVTVSELALVVLHPNNRSFKVIQLNIMETEVDAMFAQRAEMLAAGKEVATHA